MSKRVVILISSVFLFIVGIFKFYMFGSLNSPIIIEDINLEHFHKLMIVAHPDDETLWGGSHLLDDDYLVVCVTCGNNPFRAHEFNKAMNLSGDKYLMLGYPDKRNGQRSEWKHEEKKIIKDLKKIINYKNWELIVTHNPNGEYGHIQHKLINRFVTDIYHEQPNKKTKLYYFGRYYSKRRLKNYKPNEPVINKEQYDQKINLIKAYHTQKFIQTSFDQMFKYENWISYQDWS